MMYVLIAVGIALVISAIIILLKIVPLVYKECKDEGNHLLTALFGCIGISFTLLAVVSFVIAGRV